LLGGRGRGHRSSLPEAEKIAAGVTTQEMPLSQSRCPLITSLSDILPCQPRLQQPQYNMLDTTIRGCQDGTCVLLMQGGKIDIDLGIFLPTSSYLRFAEAETTTGSISEVNY
jgi:hypothetical protein